MPSQGSHDGMPLPSVGKAGSQSASPSSSADRNDRNASAEAPSSAGSDKAEDAPESTESIQTAGEVVAADVTDTPIPPPLTDVEQGSTSGDEGDEDYLEDVDPSRKHATRQRKRNMKKELEALGNEPVNLSSHRSSRTRSARNTPKRGSTVSPRSFFNNNPRSRANSSAQSKKKRNTSTSPPESSSLATTPPALSQNESLEPAEALPSRKNSKRKRQGTRSESPMSGLSSSEESNESYTPVSRDQKRGKKHGAPPLKRKKLSNNGAPSESSANVSEPMIVVASQDLEREDNSIRKRTLAKSKSLRRVYNTSDEDAESEAGTDTSRLKVPETRNANSRSSASPALSAREARMVQRRMKEAQEAKLSEQEDLTAEALEKKQELERIKAANAALRVKALATLEYEKELISNGQHPALIKLTETLRQQADLRKSRAIKMRRAKLLELARQKEAADFITFTQWQNDKQELRSSMLRDYEVRMRGGLYEFWDEGHRFTPLEMPPEPLPFYGDHDVRSMYEQTDDNDAHGTLTEHLRLSNLEIQSDFHLMGFAFSAPPLVSQVPHEPPVAKPVQPPFVQTPTQQHSAQQQTHRPSMSMPSHGAPTHTHKELGHPPAHPDGTADPSRNYGKEDKTGTGPQTAPRSAHLVRPPRTEDKARSEMTSFHFSNNLSFSLPADKSLAGQSISVKASTPVDLQRKAQDAYGSSANQQMQPAMPHRSDGFQRWAMGPKKPNPSNLQSQKSEHQASSSSSKQDLQSSSLQAQAPSWSHQPLAGKPPLPSMFAHPLSHAKDEQVPSSLGASWIGRKPWDREPTQDANGGQQTRMLPPMATQPPHRSHPSASGQSYSPDVRPAPASLSTAYASKVSR